VFTTLLIYPVAGTQKFCSTFLLLPSAVVCVADAVADLGTLAKSDTWFHHRLPSSIASTMALIAISVWCYPALVGAEYKKRYHALVQSHLDGASRLHLPLDVTGRYHWLVSNLKAHCEVFVAQPGYGSLHFWSGLAPVTGFNATAWMTLLSDR